MCDIYPARELPIEGVTSRLIYDELAPEVEKSMINRNELLSLAEKRDFDVLIILGAGDIDNDVPKLTKIINSKP